MPPATRLQTGLTAAMPTGLRVLAGADREAGTDQFRTLAGAGGVAVPGRVARQVGDVVAQRLAPAV